MTTRKTTLGLLGLLTMTGALTACSTTADATASNAPQEHGGMPCDASKVQWSIGKEADAALLAKAKADSGSQWARILTPNSIVTLEYNDFRLNLQVDVKNKVTAALCG